MTTILFYARRTRRRAGREGGVPADGTTRGVRQVECDLVLRLYRRRKTKRSQERGGNQTFIFHCKLHIVYTHKPYHNMTATQSCYPCPLAGLCTNRHLLHSSWPGPSSRRTSASRSCSSSLSCSRSASWSTCSLPTSRPCRIAPRRAAISSWSSAFDPARRRSARLCGAAGCSL